MNSTARIAEERAKQVYGDFYRQADTFNQIRDKFAPEPEIAWHLKALQEEADQLDRMMNQVAESISQQTNIVFNKPSKTATTVESASLQQAGRTLRAMRKNYAALRQIQEELSGVYIAKPPSIPLWQTILFWIVTAALVLAVYQFMLDPAARYINRVIVYQNATNAIARGDWDEAIEGFTFTYLTGPYQDSESRLINSYRQAIDVSENGENWMQMRQYARDLQQLGIADDLAQEWLRDSYISPARTAYNNEDYTQTRILLDELAAMTSLNSTAEILYKRSLLDQAEALADRQEADWEQVEILLLELLARPEENTPQEARIEEAGLDLLSRSYTERARQLLSRSEYESAREMLQPARSFPLLTVANNVVADELFFETYYAAGVDRIRSGEYEGARSQFEFLLEQPGTTYREDETEEQFRLTYYLPALAELEADNYEIARSGFSALIDLDAPQEPFRDTQANYYATFYQPAHEFLDQQPPDYDAARDVFDAMLAADAEAITYRDTRERYYDTYYYPASQLLEGDESEGIEPQYDAARALFDEMLAFEPDSIDYLDTRELYYATYYQPAVELLEADDESGENFEEARALFEAMFNAYPDSRTYRDASQQYLDTFYRPAVNLLSGDPENDIMPDYLAARDLLEVVIEFDEDYRDALERYYSTFYQPAADLIFPSGRDEEPQYEDARRILEQIFRLKPGSRDYRGDNRESAEELYWRTFYIPARDAFLTQNFLEARNDFNTILEDGGRDYLLTERLYLTTFWQRGQDFLNGNSERDVLIDYELARSEFNQIRMYLDENSNAMYPRDVTSAYAETFYRPAESALDEGRYEDARTLYGQILRLAEEENIAPYEDSLNRYQDTYIEPAEDALDAESYEITRQLIIELLDFEGITPSYEEQALDLITRSYYEPADRALADGQYEEARDLLDTLYNNYDDSQDTIERLETVYDALIRQAINADDFERAQAYLDDMRTIKPDFDSTAAELLYEFYYERGRSLLDEQEWQAARQQFTQLLESNSAYRDASILRLETFYRPALANFERGQMTDNPTLCAAARDELTTMLDRHPDTANYRDTLSLVNRTYVCEIDIAIEEERMSEARQLIRELTARSPYYRGAEQQFLVTYYEPARQAINNGRYTEARELLGDLVTLNDSFFYDDAFLLFREAYYEPALQAFETGDWQTARRELRRLLTIDPTYRNAQTLYRNAYFTPALNAFDRGNYETARAELNNLLNTVDANDSEALELLKQSYFEPAATEYARDDRDWLRIRNELEELVELDPDYRAADVMIWLLDSYYMPGLENYENENWELARVEIERLNTTLSSLRQLHTDHPQLAASLESAGLLADESIYRDADTLYLDTYLIPGTQALGSGNWQTARENLGNLVELDPDYRHPNYVDRFPLNSTQGGMMPDLNRPANELLIEAYLVPTRNAFSVEAWVLVRENVRPILTRYTDFATDTQLTEAQDLLQRSYDLPATTAAAQGDWAIARQILQQYRDDNRDLLTDDDIVDINTRIRQTYTAPVEAAIEDSAYESARDALDIFAQEYPDDPYIQETRRATYQIPFETALELEDWYSAAEQYVQLRQIVPPDDSRLQSTFIAYPALQDALANRYQAYWESPSPVDILPSEPVDQTILDVAFNETGTLYALVTLQGEMQIRSVRDDQLVLHVIAPVTRLTHIEWQPVTGNWLATSDDTDTVTIWSLNGQRIARLTNHNARITDLRTSDDGTILLSSDVTGRVLLWQSDDWSADPREYVVGQHVTSIALSPDNTQLAASIPEEATVVLDVETGSERLRIPGSTYIEDILFAPDGNSLLTMGHDNQIKQWDTNDGTLLRTLAGHEDWIRNGQFLSNNRLFMSIDAGGHVWIWDTRNWQPVGDLFTRIESIAAHWSPDSQYLLIAGRGNNLVFVEATDTSFLSQGE